MIVWAVPVTPACVISAAARMHVPMQALVGLMAAENGHVGEIRRNQNGSVDMGEMQINSTWMQSLKQFHVTQYQLTYNGCLNVLVGAWVLRKYWDEAGGKRDDIWTAIGYYHSHDPLLKNQYERSVYERLASRVTINGVISHANQWFCGKSCVATPVPNSSDVVAVRVRNNNDPAN